MKVRATSIDDSVVHCQLLFQGLGTDEFEGALIEVLCTKKPIKSIAI